MMPADYRDQTGFFNPSDFTWPVHVIGCGGIGSAVLLPLLKLGVQELHVWDLDEVEPHNIPAQLIYRLSDIGTSKAKATQAFAERQEADCLVVPHEEFVTADTTLEGVVISGVDSMTSRVAIWEAVKFNPLVPFFMDGRIGGEALQLLSLRPSDFDERLAYERWLFPDEEAAQLPCAERTVIHPAGLLANLMVAQLTRFVRDLPAKSNIMAHLKAMNFTVN